MLKEEMNAMFSDYRLLMEHLKKNKDDEGIKLLISIINSSETFIDGLFELHEKILKGK